MESPTLPIAEATDAPLYTGPSLAERFEKFKTETAPATTAETTATTSTTQETASTGEPAATELEPAETQTTGTTETTTTQQKPRRAWGELKQKADKADELERTLADKEKELVQFRQRSEELAKVDPARYEAQIAEKEAAIAKYEQKLAVFDVRESKPWREEVIAPMTKVAGDMDRLAATYRVDAQALKDALTISDPAAQMARIHELTADMTELHKNKVWGAVDVTQEIYSKAAEIEANAVEAKREMDFIRHQETEREKQTRQKELAVAAEVVQKQYKEKMPYLFEDPETAAKAFDADMSLDSNPQWKMYRAYAGAIAPILHSKLQTAQARVKELEGELSKRANLGVKAGGGSSTQQSSTSTAPAVTEGSAWQRAQSWANSKS